MKVKIFFFIRKTYSFASIYKFKTRLNLKQPEKNTAHINYFKKEQREMGELIELCHSYIKDANHNVGQDRKILNVYTILQTLCRTIQE